MVVSDEELGALSKPGLEKDHFPVTNEQLAGAKSYLFGKKTLGKTTTSQFDRSIFLNVYFFDANHGVQAEVLNTRVRTKRRWEAREKRRLQDYDKHQATTTYTKKDIIKRI